MAIAPALATVPVFHWHLPDGTPTGCGTKLEFEHCLDEGTLPEGSTRGDVLCHEPASEDDRRRALWAEEAKRA